MQSVFYRDYLTLCNSVYNVLDFKKNEFPAFLTAQLEITTFKFDVIMGIDDTYHLGQPCCRRRARQNRRCRTSQRPRSDLFRCKAQQTAPSSGGESCSAAPCHLAAPWGHTVYCADGISSSGGDEPVLGQAETACPLHVLRNL